MADLFHTHSLKDRTILLTLAGSRAYGMHTSASDVDVKGICVPTAEYFLGYFNTFHQTDDRKRVSEAFTDLLGPEELAKAKDGELEGTVYDVRKFFKLAADNNPNILDALFCRDQEVLQSNEFGDMIRDNAHIFLSKKARWTFAGYAFAQLKRIKTHKRWLMNPPTHKPDRNEYNLPDRSEIPKEQFNAAMDAIKKKIDGWEIDYGDMDEAAKLYVERQISDFLAELTITADEKFAAAARSIGYDENFIHLLQREREFKVAHTQWAQYQEWKKTRNPARAALEQKFGYDTKHGAHLVRLLRMCREILTEGQVNVWRPDAEELLAIRAGQWPYEQLIEFAETEDKSMAELYDASTLPRSPDHKSIDKLCIKVVEGML
jgi:predicted nucleotidyltransferase